MAVQLSIKVREQPTLQQRIFSEVNSTNHVSNLKHDLLSLGEVVARVAVQCELSKWCERNDVLRNDLGGIEKVETPSQLIILFHDLSLEDPLREHPVLDAFKQILTVEVGVHTCSDLSLLPQQRGFPLQCPEPEFYKLRLALIGNKAEGVHSPTISMSERADCTMTTHGPEESVHGRWLLTEEVPSTVVSGRSLRNFAIGPRLDCMYQVWELNRILNEENRNVVANDV